MSIQQWGALVATLVLGLVIVLQVLLAAGFPLGPPPGAASTACCPVPSAGLAWRPCCWSSAS